MTGIVNGFAHVPRVLPRPGNIGCDEVDLGRSDGFGKVGKPLHGTGKQNFSADFGLAGVQDVGGARFFWVVLVQAFVATTEEQKSLRSIEDFTDAHNPPAAESLDGWYYTCEWWPKSKSSEKGWLRGDLKGGTS